MWEVQRPLWRTPAWSLIAASTWACAQGVEVPSDLDGWGGESTQGRKDASDEEEDAETSAGGQDDEDTGTSAPLDAAPASTPDAGGTSVATKSDASAAVGGGMDAAIDAALADAAIDGSPAPCTSCMLKVQWNTRSVESTTQAIQGNLKLLNTGSTPISLADVSVRYWLREAMAETVIFECYHWDDGRGVNRCTRDSDAGANAYTTVSGRGVAADAGLQYVELTFPAAAGELGAAGASPGAMQLAFHLPSYTAMTQTNDPSFDPQLTSSDMDMLFDAPKITAYIKGQLAWGNEPAP